MSKPIKESPAVLPEFFIAFYLPNAARPPTDAEIEEVRVQTVEFWTKTLEHEFSKPFMRLELNVEKKIFGERQGEEKRNLGDEFNMYLELSGQAIFNGKFKGLPSGDEVFREMVAGDSMNYLTAFVRGIKTANLFGTALEVVARRLKSESSVPGGTVVCPSFFVAFALDHADPEAKIPDGALPDDLVEQWKVKTHKAMEDNLRKEWPDTFESFELDTTIADKGTMKPDDRFHLYFENEATAKFSSNPPSPEDVFRILMKSASTDATTYLLSMHDMEGTPLSCVTMVTIQLVGLEMPKVEELAPPEKEQAPGDEGDAEEGGDGEEEPELIVMNVPIFLALVINVEPPAELPKEEELLQFKDLMLRYFYTHVKNEYPYLKHMELKNETVKYGAGLPEERFNMCCEYNAELKFKSDDEPPDKEVIQKMIMEVNLSSVLAHVKNLEPLCFKHATEVTMRQKARKKDEKEIVPDSAFEAAVDAPLPLMAPPPPEPVKALPPPEKPKKPKDDQKKKEAAKKKAEEEARKKAEKAQKKAEEEARKKAEKAQKKAEEEARKKAEKAQKKAEEEARKKAEEEARQKAEEEARKKAEEKARKKAEEEARKKAEEDARKKAEEEARKKAEEEARKKAEEEARKKAEEEARLKAEEEARQKAEEEARLKAEEEAKKKKEKKKKEKLPVPPASPKPKKLDGPTELVQSSDVYVAMQLDTYSGPPTDAQIEQLRLNTREYFIKRLKHEYPGKFANLELGIAVKAFGEEEVKKYVGHQDYTGMNVYIEWISEVDFYSGDTPMSPTKKVVGSSRRSLIIDGMPTPYELTKSVVKDCDIIKYLLEHVRTIEDSDFTTATKAHIQQRIEGRDGPAKKP